MTVEERLARLEVLVEQLLKEDIKELRDQTRMMHEIVVKWRLGAVLLIGLGGAGMWIIENMDRVRRFFTG